ncbi:ParB/RepB/Spo0J family partition protein [Cohnella algarum]|uniref:ParB/RepB/Spo0J family partition protein n=1 Tax=Cohnella algarum TaxID=2044859 RepID=UPI001967E893|nr:ParB/RepB/Spo0J family partition protein [Cohnella algarum]MBN2982690.1 ParB/RepB/Spo0J family partition protein [Cohnella algarum]
MDIVQIDLSLIDEDKHQPRSRFDEEALQELTRSIEQLGLLSPIKVRKAENGRYTIIYGNRRYLACKTLGLPSIPCIVSAATDATEIYLEQVAENLTREGFSPIEEAEAYHKLLHESAFNSSLKYLGAKLGKTESYIKKKCDLLNFGPAVRELIVKGTEIRKDRLTEDQALPLKDLPMEYRDSLALTAARDELPVGDIKRIARLFKDPDISDATKAKLLYKTGPALLETWSVYESNKAERGKKPEPKARAGTSAGREATGGPGQEAAEREGGDGSAREAAGAGAQEPAGAAESGTDAGGPAAAGSGAAPAETDGTARGGGETPASAEAAVRAGMQALLAALSAAELSAEALERAAESMDPAAREAFAEQVHALAGKLERRLAEWTAAGNRIAGSRSADSARL